MATNFLYSTPQLELVHWLFGKEWGLHMRIDISLQGTRTKANPELVLFGHQASIETSPAVLLSGKFSVS